MVGEVFAKLGACVARADDIAHQLMLPGNSVYREIVQHFGDSILNPDGTINRGQLAKIAFSSSPSGSKPRIEELNQIVHPAVIEKQEEWMRQIGSDDPRAIAIVEAALILEADLTRHFDKLIVVTCRPEQRIERWAARTGVDIETARQQIDQRMAAQWPEEIKIKAADFVIDNSGSMADAELQIRHAYQQLQQILIAQGLT